MKPVVAAALALGFVLLSDSLGGTEAAASATDTATENEESSWQFSLTGTTYVARNAHDYFNPTLTADGDWLHLEARYNYEALKTGSIWLGYNFNTGDKLAISVTPMLGGIFGDLTGIAPGYTIELNYGPFEAYTQGEYFIDTGMRSGNFFYNWSEFSIVPVRWIRVGLVLDRTKALGDDLSIRRGPLLGFRYKDFDFTTYWLSPGSNESTFVFAATINF
jgi:hypothetical protein